MKMYSLRKLGIALMICCACLLGASNIQAATFEIDFTADFTAGPVSSVTGSITYEADAIDTAVTALTSIDLTIGNHTYTLDEIGFTSPYPNASGTRTMIGAITFGGVSGVLLGANDFWFSFYHIGVTPAGYDLRYSTTELGQTSCYSTTFSEFSITEVTNNTSVPEPASLLLFGLGLIGLAGVRKRFKK